LNYIHDGLSIQTTKDDKGRGVFTTKKIKRKELLIVERAITSAPGTHAALTTKCKELASHNGIRALRMSYLHYEGLYNHRIPPIKVFTENTYKDYEIKVLTDEILESICLLNSFASIDPQTGNHMSYLYGFFSMLNHG